MTTAIVQKSLKLLRQLALQVQVGNVKGKAPEFAFEPEENEKLFGPYGGAENLHVWKLNDVVCSGLYGGAIINKFNQLYLRFISFPWGKTLHPASTLPYVGKNVGEIEKAIYLITPEAPNNYYHWVVDLLPRLLVLTKYSLSDLKDRVIILHHTAKSYETNYLAMLGIEKEKVFRLKPFETVKVKDLVVADYYGLNKPFAAWKKEILDQLSANKPRLPKKKIYLLRGKQAKRSLIGEERLVAMLEKLGFTIVNPQGMTVEEQINTLREAEVVVALHGAALTNIIFCEPQTLVVELRSTHLPPEHYSAIAKTYNFRFKTVSLPPERQVKKSNSANKQSLVLTEEAVAELMTLLGEREKQASFK
ncbi:glycosyltransferase family 61 protein [Larkinella insperata]|uniref:Glycosyltransferase family 61 protein n=1 Tax=Larkinella insperata TaxID=332158 RepID=A0ABW3QH08_9BACT|nr:glycosyltransferase family 61 protein [Larkinella insperata]